MVQLSLDQLVAEIDRAAVDPLRRLTFAVLASERLTATADDLVGHFVEAARATGASWADVGAALGVSKQAAQQRQVAREESDDDLGAALDDDTLAVLVRAQQEAAGLNHLYVGTEHLLVAVLRLHQPLVSAVGLTADDAVDATVAVVGRGEGAGMGSPGFTARSKKVLEISEREAYDLGASRVAPGHLVLGMLREGKGIAAHLIAARADAGTVRDRLETLLTA